MTSRTRIKCRRYKKTFAGAVLLPPAKHPQLLSTFVDEICAAARVLRICATLVAPAGIVGVGGGGVCCTALRKAVPPGGGGP